MKLDVPTILGIFTVFILCIFASSIAILDNPANSVQFIDSQPSISSLERDSKILSEINQQAIFYQKNNETEKLSEQKKLMHERLETISSQTLRLNIFIDDLYDSLFPFADGSEIKIPEDKEQIEICNIAENLPLHFEKIKNARMFKMFAEKYSEYPIELSLQDERRNNSSFHFGLIAKSDDGRYALTYFHVNSCTNEIIDADDYFLSCHNDQIHEVFGTKNRGYVLASLNHTDFCTIPLDDWHQSLYDYGRKLSEKEEQYIHQLENAKYDDETVRALQIEMRQIGLLHNLVVMMVSETVEDKAIQEKIQGYKKTYGTFPDEFLKLLEKKK
ncbi:MAG: hypothetical protein PVH93_07945 [Nitrosopumilaceae archaeon]|jgi:hypothetical protein